MIIHKGKSIVTLKAPQDPASARRYTLILRPPVWVAETVYYEGESVVIPAVFNGFYHLAISGGLSGATPPDFPCKKGELTPDACVLWEAIPYDILLRPGQSISSVTWSCTNPEVTITGVMFDADSTSALISTLPAEEESVTIKVNIPYGDEKVDPSFIIPIAEL